MPRHPILRRFFAIALLSALQASAAEHWLRISTPDFELYTAAGEKRGRDALRHFEQVREFFLRASPVRSLGDVPLRIFQFDTEAQFAPFRPNASTVAAFVASAEREYILLGDRTADNYQPSIHEYMHLIVRHSGLKLPLWLNEGWADVFSSLRPMGKETAVGDLLPDRMKTLADGEWLDFDTLTAVDHQSPEYHENSRVGMFYAESWALAHMLYLSPEYKDNFGKFIAALQSGRNTAEACQLAFGRSSGAVFEDLRAYLGRKRIYGRVFETSLEKSQAQAVSTPLSGFDSALGLADLLATVGRRTEAKAEYARLEGERPDDPELVRSLGYFAMGDHNTEAARRYFRKAFDAGSTDPVLCFELAQLDMAARQPFTGVIPALERAVKSKPDFTQAKIQLGLLRVELRDFPAAVSELMSIPTIRPEQAESVYCGLTVAYLQTGELDRARDNLADCRKWAKTDNEIRHAEAIGKFVEARSKPFAAVRPGEKLQRIAGVARNLQCSPEGSRLEIAIGDKVATFDLPEREAVELPPAPKTPLVFACGALKPVPIGIEYAPPRVAGDATTGVTMGVVRRLAY